MGGYTYVVCMNPSNYEWKSRDSREAGPSLEYRWKSHRAMRETTSVSDEGQNVPHSCKPDPEPIKIMRSGALSSVFTQEVLKLPY